MKKWLVVLIVLSLILSVGFQATCNENETVTVPLVVVYLESPDQIAALLEAGLDIVGIDLVNLEIEVVLNDYDREYLDNAGLKYDILIEDLTYYGPETTEFGIMSVGREDYRRWHEIEEELQTFEEIYPDLTRLHILGHSHQGRPIYALEISAAPGVNDGRPESVHMALYHAREWPTTEMALDLAWYLLDNYGIEEKVTNIVNTIRVWIIPVVNPDGYVHSQNVYQMWRKNRRHNSDNSWGVDLNRNHSYNWGGVGSSGVTTSDTYRGPSPTSEPELWAIRDLFLGRHIITTLSGHTHGRYVLWSWGYKPDLIPDHSVHADLGNQYQAFNGYPMNRVGPSNTTIYATSGASDDWVYGVFRGISFTFEYGTAFIPPYMGTITTANQLVTEQFGTISGNLLTFSVLPGGESGNLVNCGKGLTPDDFPAEVAGNIALIERGDGTFRLKADNAVAAGAVGVVIYNNTTGAISGTLGSAGVPVPVLGITRADGLLIKNALDSGQEVTGTLRQAVVVSNSYQQEWERNLPAFLLNIESAATYASVVYGNITDKLSGEPLAANLDMAVDLRSRLSNGQFINEPHRTSISAYGSYQWYILPSNQPELETPPYTITVSSPGRYSQQVELTVSSYQEAHELNFELQPVSKVLVPPVLSWQPNATIPFKFVTFNRDGEAEFMSNVTVALVKDGAEIVFTEAGFGARFVRKGDNNGEYIVNINTRALGLKEGVYDVIIRFNGAEGELEYPTTITLKAQARQRAS